MLLALLLQTPLTSCDAIVNDQFECGRPDNENGALAKICSRPGESCVCSTNRCAKPDGSCPGSGLRYVFGKDDCVPQGPEASSAIRQIDQTSGFCEGQGPVRYCGERGDTACPADQACVCATNRCARYDAARCEDSKYADAASGACIAVEDARPEVMLFADSDNPAALCPGAQLPPPCGVAIAGKPVVNCKGTARCVCAEDEHRCVFKSNGCDSKYAWQQDGMCVTELSTEQLEDPALQVDGQGYCPGENPGGAGGMSTMGGMGGMPSTGGTSAGAGGS
jgi:hypothetical protein